MLYRDFWAAGYRVFGLHPIVDGKCGCGNKGCIAIGKHPLVSNWTHTPVWSAEQVETMETMDEFATGFGVLIRGLFVIDVDARNGGVASYERLKNDFPVIQRAGLIVQTGSGGGSQHLYFSVPEGLALVQSHPDYPGIDFKSSGFVVGPGSLHASGARYEVSYGSVDDIEPAPDSLLALLAKPEYHRTEVDGTFVDVSHADLADMLSYVDPDADHETWVRCGMAAHHGSGGTAFDVWDAWSNKGTKYPGRETLSKRWHSFGKSANPVTLGTLTHHAEAGGWKQSVTFEPLEVVEEPTQGLDISGIDLKTPPGFVGQIANWINDQCRRPRETLAVAGALTAIGNVIGLRYTDDLDGVTGNLFTFCVAGSGTGKEAIQQAVAEVHRAAGIQAASHGAIKSEQEILRNLVRHQAAFYVIDEIGIFLKKIKNAQQKGGAAYLDGVIGALMAAYSKSDGFMLLTGDMKEEVRKLMRAECTQLEKQIEERPSGALEMRLDSIRIQMQKLDHGLEKPFLSLIGFTTPVTFDDLVDFHSATNGFIGRSLLFNERETAPARKKRFKKRKMPESMMQSLSQLYSGGSYDLAGPGRVEFYQDRIEIPTTEGAGLLLDQVNDVLEEMAYAQKSITGLEALPLRAYEQVAKVSLILSAPGGIRTEEHVRWAYALVKRDIEEKMNLVTANDRQKDAPVMALRSKIMNVISGDEGETLGVLANRLRSNKRADIEKCLEEMVKAGVVTIEETKHKYNKGTVKRYKGQSA